MARSLAAQEAAKKHKAVVRKLKRTIAAQADRLLVKQYRSSERVLELVGAARSTRSTRTQAGAPRIGST
jgi:hypothetical protein